MQTFSVMQSIKIILIILLITGIFWIFKNQFSEQMIQTPNKKDIAQSITVPPTKTDEIRQTEPQTTTIEAPSVNSTPSDSIPLDNFEIHEMLDSTDLSELDLGGIDKIPTAEEKEELMKYAPGANESGFMEDPPELGEISIYGDPPGADDIEIIGISPETIQP